MLDTDRAAIRDGINALSDTAMLYRRLFKDLYHHCAELHQRIEKLEREKAEMREERERFARRCFPDAAPKEQP